MKAPRNVRLPPVMFVTTTNRSIAGFTVSSWMVQSTPFCANNSPGISPVLGIWLTLPTLISVTENDGAIDAAITRRSGRYSAWGRAGVATGLLVLASHDGGAVTDQLLIDRRLGDGGFPSTGEQVRSEARSAG